MFSPRQCGVTATPGAAVLGRRYGFLVPLGAACGMLITCSLGKNECWKIERQVVLLITNRLQTTDDIHTFLLYGCLYLLLI